MADVFLSYKSEDRDLVQTLAHALEREGISVWWDKKIAAGGTWRETIASALAEAKVVIVAWSKRTENSVDAAWVFNEVDEAQRMKLPMIPVQLEACNIPLGYRHVQAADLTAWRGDPSNHEWLEVRDGVRAAIAGKAVGGATTARRAAAPAPAPVKEKSGGMGGVLVALVAILVLGGGGYAAWRMMASPQAAQEGAVVETAATAPLTSPQDDGGQESAGTDGPATIAIGEPNPATPPPAPLAPPRVVHFGGGGEQLGSFRNEGNGVWGEYRLNGERAFEFRTARETATKTEIYDESRQVWIEIDYAANAINLHVGDNTPYQQQYLITSVDR
ncbi:MAG: toll/interleukin-1 receptor domain-containing protein [Terricaulis sp.]